MVNFMCNIGTLLMEIDELVNEYSHTLYRNISSFISVWVSKDGDVCVVAVKKMKACCLTFVIQETYENWKQNMWDPTHFQDKAILAHTYEEVDKVNEHMMSKLPGREKVYYSSDIFSDIDVDFNYDESLYYFFLL
ncbi:ATP-dependent DNA helicase PIF1 [Artemisia annua]|uniref:ATP-dependent DNA helicase PIF1 n=1 Tax=Artemisia annua TaxID=35608 RepID=A0A2U1KNM8_ARTAN|nr:ATP-dependent DNA helicase PIF1 [Artemisia annua]